jgi:hypothetical protein
MSITFLDESADDDSTPDIISMSKFQDENPVNVHNNISVHERHALNINCLSIANHIKVCPLCSQFYKCDKKSQNITIFVLLIILCILFKKILKL